jgi:RNA polymerase sigma factor for flagellar operon FliA
MSTRSKNISGQVLTKCSKKHLKAVALRTYSGHRKQTVDNERIVSLLPMVHGIAQKVVTYLKPPLSFGDLVSAGTIGLVKAARDFDPSCRAEFKTYAYIRIKGAILDELRGWSFVSANLHRQIRKAIQFSREITERTGAAPADDELAEKLGITIDELHKIFESIRAQQFVSMDGAAENMPALSSVLSSTASAPDEQMERRELIDRLADAIKQLPEKQRQVILLYYQQNLTMKQIAGVLGVTESRISQLHAGAIFNLSVRLRQWKNNGK